MAILPRDPLWPSPRENPRLLDQYGLPISADDDQSGPVIPHPLTFGMVLNIIAKTYSYRWDEALRHLPQNALAMRRDCFIKALLQERKLPTVNRKWQLVPDLASRKKSGRILGAYVICMEMCGRRAQIGLTAITRDAF